MAQRGDMTGAGQARPGFLGRFVAAVESTPTVAALRNAGATVSFAELHENSDRVAAALHRRGVASGGRVAVRLDHSAELLTAIIGVLKCGAAFVPLDAQQTDERTSAMLAAADVDLVIRKQGGADVATLLAEGADRTLPEVSIDPGQPAYVIFTSGSTGQPKGVVVSHRALGGYLDWAIEAYLSRGPHGAPLYSSIGFDLTLTSLLGPLAGGKTIDLVPAERGIAGVADLLVAGVSFDMVKLTPSHLRLLMALLPPGAVHGEVACLVVGGEKLPPDLVRAWQAIDPTTSVINEYGPTEATVGCCTYEVGRDDDLSGDIPIGRPISGVRLQVLDAEQRPAPFGTVGELYIGGSGLADGYLHRPDLTSASFVLDPTGNRPDAVVYRSGDLVRHRADGELVFVGRADEQVKVRGYRIEPAEVEAALVAHPAIQTAAVVGLPDPSSGHRLAGYFTVVPDAVVPGVSAVRAFLEQRLPDYMIPASLTELPVLPLTANGKLDRDALPVDVERPDLDTAFVAPRTVTERAIAAIWSELLGIDDIGVDDNFFELGGHSLLTVQVLWRLQESLAVDVPLSALLDAWTLGELADVVDSVGTQGAEAIVPVPREGGLPLSHAQQRLWFVTRLTPGNAFANVGLDLRLTGPLDEEALARTVTEIERRHESLRTRFVDHEGRPTQVIDPPRRVSPHLIDLMAMSVADRRSALNRIAREEALRPFDLATGPLFRVSLVRMGPGDNILLMTMHHIVTDGWSKEILSRELAALYRAYRAGRASPLPEPAVQYADFATWQRRILNEDLLGDHLKYWQRQLSGAPPFLDLPADRPRPALLTYEAGRLPFTVPEAVIAKLRAVSRNGSATMFMTLLAAFQTLLQRYSGQDDICVGSPVAGRARAEVQNVVGFFVNTLVMRTDLSGDPSFTELLQRVRRMALGAYSHQDLPFERLVEEMQPVRDLSRNPLVQVLFWHLPEQTTEPATDWGDVDARLVGPEGDASIGYGGGAATIHCDLELFLRERGGALVGSVTYSTELFETATIERLIRHFQRLLREIADAPGEPLSGYELLTSEEKDHLLAASRSTDVIWPGDVVPHQLFEARAAQEPDATALTCGAVSLSYAHLDRRANAVADYLRKGHGVGPDGLVGVCLEPDEDAVVAVLGILKTGAAYFAIEPGTPDAEQERLLGEAGLSLVLTQRRLLGRLPGCTAQLVCLDGDLNVVDQASADVVVAAPGPENLIHVLPTRGDDGVLRSLMRAHRTLTNDIHWCQRAHPLRLGDTVLQRAPLTSHLSAVETFWALASGAHLVMAPSADWRASDGIATRTAEGGTREISGLYTPAGDQIVASGMTPLPVGGADFRPIGELIPNVRAYVLDGTGNIAPVGVVGEIHVGGGMVPRGYLYESAATAEHFVPDPFSATPGGRLRSTGDRGRFRLDGTIELVARASASVVARAERPWLPVEFAAPRTRTENVLSAIWAELLEIDRVGVEDNFFELGGQSLLGLQVLWKVEESLGVRLPLRALFETPTVCTLAERIDQGSDGALTRRVPRGTRPQLSYAQQRLWFLDRLTPGDPAYHLQIAVRLTGDLNVAAMVWAVGAVVGRHEVLRTTFATSAGRPWQRVAATAPYGIPLTDLTALPPLDRADRARQTVIEETNRPFDLLNGPVWRARLIRHAGDEHTLLWTMHHVAGDGRSLGLITRELAAFYRAKVTGEPPAVAEVPLQYADFAAAQRAWLDSRAKDRMLAYWRDQLAGAGQLELPADHPREALRNEGAAHIFELNDDLVVRLKEFSRTQGVTLFMTMLAGFEVLMARYSGQDDFTIGVPITDRPYAETADLVGLFLNAMVVRADLSDDQSFHGLLQRVRETVTAAYEHQELPFEMLVDDLSPDRDLSRNPLYQVDFQVFPRFSTAEGLALPGLTVRDESQAPATTAVLDLSCYLAEWEGRIRGVIRYRTGLFEAATIERLSRHYEILLDALLRRPDQPVSVPAVVTPAELDQVVRQWNDTAADRAPTCVNTLFEEQVRRSPHAIAVEFEGDRLSYQELDKKANQLAHRLRHRGAGTETRIGLFLERGVLLFVGLLGILKAGAAYVPLDPSHPADRHRRLLDDTAAPLVVTQRSWADLLPAGDREQVFVDDPALAEMPVLRPETQLRPENTAYVMYTSGSTGQPKGVLIEHRGAANFARELRWAPPGTTGRIAMNASVAFDQSLDTLLAICHGWQIVLVPAGIRRSPDGLIAWLGQSHIDVLECTPTQAELLLRAGLRESPHAPAVMLVSGEEIGPRLWQQLRELDGVTVWNAYGPTECTIDTTVARVGDHERPTIGRPIGNAQAYILDAALNPVPVGVAGEIHLGGIGLARGYLHRPALTARQFVPDPFSARPGARMYRTGDRARFRPDGTIEFLGRGDEQVKIRGYRVEPAEIEVTLVAHPALARATVVAQADPQGGRRLVAYFAVEAGSATPTGSELRTHLQRSLPEHMIPSAFVALDALPLTANGKLDKAALPVPEDRPELGNTFEAPRTRTEKLLAGIWCAVLGVSRVGVHDNFFELGGHSLLTAQVMWDVQQQFGLEVGLEVFFEALTVAQLAEVVDDLATSTRPGSASPQR